MRLSLQTLALSLVVTVSQPSDRVEVLSSTSGLPAHVMGQFLGLATFQEAANGERFVFDRRAQSVYRIDRSGETRKVIEIGPERGRLLGASSLSRGPGRAVRRCRRARRARACADF